MMRVVAGIAGLLLVIAGAINLVRGGKVHDVFYVVAGTMLIAWAAGVRTTLRTPLPARIIGVVSGVAGIAIAVVLRHEPIVSAVLALSSLLILAATTAELLGHFRNPNSKRR